MPVHLDGHIVEPEGFAAADFVLEVAAHPPVVARRRRRFVREHPGERVEVEAAEATLDGAPKFVRVGGWDELRRLDLASEVSGDIAPGPGARITLRGNGFQRRSRVIASGEFEGKRFVASALSSPRAFWKQNQRLVMEGGAGRGAAPWWLLWVPTSLGLAGMAAAHVEAALARPAALAWSLALAWTGIALAFGTELAKRLFGYPNAHPGRLRWGWLPQVSGADVNPRTWDDSRVHLALVVVIVAMAAVVSRNLWLGYQPVEPRAVLGIAGGLALSSALTFGATWVRDRRAARYLWMLLRAPGRGSERRWGVLSGSYAQPSFARTVEVRRHRIGTRQGTTQQSLYPTLAPGRCYLKEPGLEIDLSGATVATTAWRLLAKGRPRFVEQRLPEEGELLVGAWFDSERRELRRLAAEGPDSLVVLAVPRGVSPRGFVWRRLAWRWGLSALVAGCGLGALVLAGRALVG